METRPLEWPNVPAHGTFGATISLMIDGPDGKSFSGSTKLSGEGAISGLLYSPDFAKMYQHTTFFRWSNSPCGLWLDISFFDGGGQNAPTLGLFQGPPARGFSYGIGGYGDGTWR